MRARLSVARAEPPFELPRATHADLASLRRRIAGPMAHTAVAVDFLEDDLREAEGALGAVTDWLGAVEEALRDPRVGRRDLSAMLGGDALTRVEDLSAAMEGIRRRLAEVAERLPEPRA
jgi:hypothetical protein